jgi:phosphoglycolate phosphatase-like HAD superfamily hydrolase
MAGRKRARSEDIATAETGAEKALKETRLVLLHINALLDYSDAVLGTVRGVIDEVFGDREKPEISDEQIMAAMCATPFFEQAINFLGIRCLTSEERVRLSDAYWRNYNQLGGPRLKLTEGVKELLDEIEQQGMVLAIMSNNPNGAKVLLTRLGAPEFVGKVRE